MDFMEAKAHMPIINNRVELAKSYRDARKKASEAKYNLEVILAANLSRIRDMKSNVGYDMAILMMLEPGFLSDDIRSAVLAHYRDMSKYTSEYKGLERLMSALESKVTFVQSLMRYERDST